MVIDILDVEPVDDVAYVSPCDRYIQGSTKDFFISNVERIEDLRFGIIKMPKFIECEYYLQNIRVDQLHDWVIMIKRVVLKRNRLLRKAGFRNVRVIGLDRKLKDFMK